MEFQRVTKLFGGVQGVPIDGVSMIANNKRLQVIKGYFADVGVVVCFDVVGEQAGWREDEHALDGILNGGVRDRRSRGGGQWRPLPGGVLRPRGFKEDGAQELLPELVLFADGDEVCVKTVIFEPDGDAIRRRIEFFLRNEMTVSEVFLKK